jgi:hypothetical protein
MYTKRAIPKAEMTPSSSSLITGFGRARRRYGRATGLRSDMAGMRDAKKPPALYAGAYTTTVRLGAYTLKLHGRSCHGSGRDS